MIAHLRGKLLAKHPNQVVVETSGIGYDVTISVPTFSDLPDVGSEVALHIHTHVREDLIALQFVDGVQRAESIAALAAVFRTQTAEEWLARFQEADACLTLVKEVAEVIDDPQVQIAPIGTFRNPNESPTDTELFRIIERTIRRHYPGVPVTTKMLSGATESVLIRPFGTVSYGFTPLLATSEEVATAHGDDERVREDTMRRSVAVFYDVVSDLCRHRN